MSQTEPSIRIENVVASVILGHNLDLPSISRALPEDIEYNPERFPGALFRLKRPKTAILIFSSGKMICVGAKSERLARLAVRKVMRRLRESGIVITSKAEITIENIVASASLGGKIDLEKASFTLRRTMYEPEQFPGLIYRMDEPKVVILIFASGKLVIVGAREEGDVRGAVGKLKEQLEERELIFY